MHTRDRRANVFVTRVCTRVLLRAAVCWMEVGGGSFSPIRVQWLGVDPPSHMHWVGFGGAPFCPTGCSEALGEGLRLVPPQQCCRGGSGLCLPAYFAKGHPEVRHYWRKAPDHQQRPPAHGRGGGGGGTPPDNTGCCPIAVPGGFPAHRMEVWGGFGATSNEYWGRVGLWGGMGFAWGWRGGLRFVGGLTP